MDIDFIWIRAATRLLVITINSVSGYRNRKAGQNALHTICKSSLLTALCSKIQSHTHSLALYQWCQQLLLLLERDSSFDTEHNSMHGYCVPVGIT